MRLTCCLILAALVLGGCKSPMIPLVVQPAAPTSTPEPAWVGSVRSLTGVVAGQPQTFWGFNFWWDAQAFSAPTGSWASSPTGSAYLEASPAEGFGRVTRPGTLGRRNPAVSYVVPEGLKLVVNVVRTFESAALCGPSVTVPLDVKMPCPTGEVRVGINGVVVPANQPYHFEFGPGANVDFYADARAAVIVAGYLTAAGPTAGVAGTPEPK